MTGYVPRNERKHRAHAKLLAAVGTGKRVLDVGCSSGYLAEAGNTVVGIDIDAEAAREAERWCERVVVGDVETMPLADLGRFDVILCGDVLEHLRDPRAALARLRPLGDRLVASTPNIANWAIRLSLLGGRWRYTERGILDRTHTHLFTRSTLREAVESAGWRVEKIDFSVPVPGNSDTLDAVGYAIGRLRPTVFAYQFIITAS